MAEARTAAASPPGTFGPIATCWCNKSLVELEGSISGLNERVNYAVKGCFRGDQRERSGWDPEVAAEARFVCVHQFKPNA